METLIKAQLAAGRVELASGEPAIARMIASQARDTARWSHMASFELQSGLLAARAAWQAGDASGAATDLAGLLARAEERGYRTLAAECHDLCGRIRAGEGNPAGAVAEYRRAGNRIKDILETMSDEDRRSFVHHPVWRAAISNLLDSLTQLGQREEALGYLIPLGVGVCEIQPARPGEVPQTVA